MPRILIRSLAAALFSAMALAACGGTVVPAQTGAAAASSGEIVATSTPNPCYTRAVQPAWIFMGSCVIATLPSKGATFSLAQYKGVTASVTLPGNNGGNENLTVVDARGIDDISKYKQKPFPTIETQKPVVYVEIVNAKKGLKFSGSGAVVFEVASTSAFPGKDCLLAFLEKRGRPYAWVKTGVKGRHDGSGLAFRIPADDVNLFFPSGLTKGPVYFNIGCE